MTRQSRPFAELDDMTWSRAARGRQKQNQGVTLNAVDGGYVNASEGEELVAVFAEDEWYYGFPLKKRLQMGWFRSEDCITA